MKRVSLLAVLALCFSCNTPKTAMIKTSEPIKSEIESVCPEDGNCTVTLLRNKSMVLQRDGTGYLHYVLEETPGYSVIHFEYIRKTDPNLQDAGYREEILFEIPNDTERISLFDKDLAQVKMLFGRHCFCRGQAGYFQVLEGKLDLVHHEEKVVFTVDFKCSEVPQIISSVKASLK